MRPSGDTDTRWSRPSGAGTSVAVPSTLLSAVTVPAPPKDKVEPPAERTGGAPGSATAGPVTVAARPPAGHEPGGLAERVDDAEHCRRAERAARRLRQLDRRDLPRVGRRRGVRLRRRCQQCRCDQDGGHRRGDGCHPTAPSQDVRPGPHPGREVDDRHLARDVRQRAAQLSVRHPHPPDDHRASSAATMSGTTWRSRARPRALWLRTVPTEHPSIAATSPSGRSSK